MAASIVNGNFIVSLSVLDGKNFDQYWVVKMGVIFDFREVLKIMKDEIQYEADSATKKREVDSATKKITCHQEAFEDAIKNQKNIGEEEKRRRLNEWIHYSNYEKCLSNEDGRGIAEILGVRNLFWDWDFPKTREGFYRFKGSVKAAIVRAFSELADVIWMETSSPNASECTEFEKGVKSNWPEMMLAYNLSPSFNWDASGMDYEEMRDFIPRIARLGYVWQFIIVGGVHSNALMTSTYAGEHARNGTVEVALKLFDEMPNRDSFTYTALVDGLFFKL